MVAHWASWGAKARGGTHATTNMPCQDDWTSCHASWGDVVVVSDGMGSCKEAEFGANAACRAVVTAAKLFAQQTEALPHDLLALVYAHWRFFIAPYEPQDCRATCLFALHCQNKVFLAQLGDGMMILIRDQAKPAFVYEEKEFANITTGLGEKHNPERWQILTIPDSEINAVILATDGVADDLDPEKQSSFAQDLHNDLINTKERKRHRTLRKMLRKWANSSFSDDKTIACLYQQTESTINGQ